MQSDYQELRQFISDNLLFGQAVAIGDDDSFLEKGIIDSTGVLELVSFLERHYRIKVDDEDLIQQNLDSIKGLVGFLDRKRRLARGEAA